jgi:hypothetical protein
MSFLRRRRPERRKTCARLGAFSVLESENGENLVFRMEADAGGWMELKVPPEAADEIGSALIQWAISRV